VITPGLDPKRTDDVISVNWYFICLHIGRCNQKFPDWPPGARTANSTALCHWVQLYHYFVSQSSEFFRHNPLCDFSTSVYCFLFRYDPVWKLLDTPSYNNVWEVPDFLIYDRLKTSSGMDPFRGTNFLSLSRVRRQLPNEGERHKI
jgi:hypothetical protein